MTAKPMTALDEQYIIKNVPLLGTATVAKKLDIAPRTIGGRVNRLRLNEYLSNAPTLLPVIIDKQWQDDELATALQRAVNTNRFVVQINATIGYSQVIDEDGTAYLLAPINMTVGTPDSRMNTALNKFRKLRVELASGEI